jgi:hypothetical protein
LDALTPETVSDYARRLLNLDDLTILTLGPEPLEIKAPA